MSKTKTREITIVETKGAFSFFKKPGEETLDFSGMKALRQLLSNEKARILHVIKTQNPGSIYDLSKKLNRNFKAVMDDLKFLERLGFIEFIAEKHKNRVRHKPVILVDTMTFHIKI